jgi:ankyrin repeat protein
MASPGNKMSEQESESIFESDAASTIVGSDIDDRSDVASTTSYADTESTVVGELDSVSDFNSIITIKATNLKGSKSQSKASPSSSANLPPRTPESGKLDKALSSLIVRSEHPVLENATSLHIAAQNGQDYLLRALCATGLNPNAIAGPDELTPLHMVCNGQIDDDKAARMATILLKASVSPTIRCANKYRTPLHYAEDNCLRRVAYILIASPCTKSFPLEYTLMRVTNRATGDPKLLQDEKYIVWMMCTKHHSKTYFLHRCHVDVTYRPEGESKTMLTDAIGKIDLIGVLRKHNADPNLEDGYGNTPIELDALKCSSASSYPSIFMLISYGAGPMKQDSEGQTALHCAATNEYSDGMVRRLFKDPESSVDPNVKNADGLTPSQYLVKNPTRAVRVFKWPAPQNAQSGFVTDLVENGADIGVIDSDGKSLLDIALDA